MEFFRSVARFFRTLFGLDDGMRAELKRIHAPLARIKPPYYRFKGNLVMPGFAQDLFLFCKALKPLMDLADRTLAHPDLRVARRYFDYLVDCELPPADLEKKASFHYEGLKLRLENAVKADEELEAVTADFQRFLGSVDDLAAGPLDAELAEVERFIEICRHDWERVLGFFDPGVSLDETRYHPDFQPCDGDMALPELVDVYFLTNSFSFSESLFRKVMKVFEKLSPATAESRRVKMGRMFETLNKVLRSRLNDDNLLALIRLAKQDALYQPATKRDSAKFVEQYRERLVQQFDRDRERLQRERHESSVAQDIRDLFGAIEVSVVEEYDEENDAYLRRESPSGFSHIKAMGILKTFVAGIFEQHIKELVKKVLVEGYFDSKSFQNNLANILYQCDRTAGRIAAFEEGLRSNGRVSIGAVRRFVEEMRHGKDVMPFLSKIVDEINYKAREICDDETGLFKMLGETLGELLADYKKSSPDLVTNIRNLGGMRNKEIMAALTDGKRRIETFVRVMRNFSGKAEAEGAGLPRMPVDGPGADALAPRTGARKGAVRLAAEEPEPEDLPSA